TTVHECISSIVRLKVCLEDIQENYSEILNPVILTILRSRGFFSDMQYLSEILLSIKDAILSVKANRSTLADCYINLMRIAVAIQNLPTDEYRGFCNYSYKGIGLKFGTFPLIASYAGKLRQQMGKSQESCEALITQLYIDRLEGLAKVYQFNLSNPIDQLRYTQIMEITPEIILILQK
ncbi:8449_t:CDS:2, partial [Dentiscutata erythropus]